MTERGLILFDLDGTLADSAPGLSAAANEMRRRRSLSPLPYEALREHCGSGAAGLIWAGLRLTPQAAVFEATKREFLTYYAQIMMEKSTLFAGVTDMLTKLTRRGLTWGIVTNKVIDLARPLCEAKGLADQAACILSGQTLGAPKPAPRRPLVGHEDPGLYGGRDDLRRGRRARRAGRAQRGRGVCGRGLGLHGKWLGCEPLGGGAGGRPRGRPARHLRRTALTSLRGGFGRRAPVAPKGQTL